MEDRFRTALDKEVTGEIKAIIDEGVPSGEMMMLAILRKKKIVLEELLKAGGPPDYICHFENCDGDTYESLIQIALDIDYDMVDILLKYEANIDLEIELGNSTEIPRIAGQGTLLVEMLNEFYDNANSNDDRRLALEHMKFLLSRGANPARVLQLEAQLPLGNLIREFVETNL
jgi:hypothetical protein